MELRAKKGESFLIDDEDYDLIKDIPWNVDVDGYLKAYCKKDKKTYRIYRLILGVDNPNILVDHKNRNPLDNRKCNLRLCNNSENQKNKKARGSSKYLGVSIHSTTVKRVNKKGESVVYHSKSSFLSRIVINGKQKHLGKFDNEIDAAKKYNEFALKYHGEFANLNTFD